MSWKTFGPFPIGITMRPRTFFSGNVVAGLVTTAVFTAFKYAACVSGRNVTRTAGGPAAGSFSSSVRSTRNNGCIKYLRRECRAKVRPGASL